MLCTPNTKPFGGFIHMQTLALHPSGLFSMSTDLFRVKVQDLAIEIASQEQTSHI